MIDRIRRQIDDLLDFLTSGPSVSPPGSQIKPEIFEFDARLNPSNITLGTPTSVNEGTALQFPVTLDSPPTSFPVTVDYTTSDVTAVAGTNYTASSGTVTIPLGSLNGTIIIPTQVDGVVTPSLDMAVTLSNPSAGDTIVGAKAVGTINNTDIAQFNITGGTVQEGGQETFTITLSKPVSVATAVDFTTADGSAFSGTNYTGVTGQTVNFPALTTSQTITVNTIQDNIVTPTLDFSGQLGNINDGGLTGFVTFASGSTPAATGTITNIDTAVLSITSAVDSVEGGSILYTLSLSKPSSTQVFVDFSTSDGTALASNGRYVPITNQTVTIPSGLTSQFVQVTTLDDRIVQGSENILGSLSNLSGINITLDSTAVPANILDNDTATLTTAGGILNVTEGAGPLSIPVVMTLNTTGTGPIGLGKPVSVSFNGFGTAVQGTNYTVTPANFVPGNYPNGSVTANALFNVIDTARVKPTLQSFLSPTILSDGTNGQANLGFFNIPTISIQSNDIATIGFTTTSQTVNETAGKATVVVTLTLNTTGVGTPGLDAPISAFIFNNIKGTAISNRDFSFSFQQLNFPAGDGTSFTQSFDVSIVKNNIVTGDITLGLGLNAFSFQFLGTALATNPSETTLTIIDADSFQFQPPRIQLNQYNIPLTPGNFINTYLDTTTDLTNPYASSVSVVGGAELSGLTGKDIQSKTFTVPGFNEFNGGLAVSNGVAFAGASKTGNEASSTNPYSSVPTDDASALLSYNPGTQQFNVLGLFNRESTGLAVAPDGSLVNAWFDGTYGTSSNPYANGPDAAVIGLSRIDPVTGAETILYQQALTAAQVANRSTSQMQHIGGVAVLPDGQILFATSEEGVVGTSSSAPRDDSSTFFRFDPVTKSLTQLGTFSRETRSLSTAKDGSVVSLFYDGTYGTNPYGSLDSAIIGISQINPSTGSEQILDTVTVPNLPRTGFGFSASTNPYSDGSDFQPGGLAILGSGDIVYSLEKSAVQQPGPNVSAEQTIYRQYNPATKATNANFAQYLGRTSNLAAVPLLPTTATDTFTTKLNQPLTVNATGVLANDAGQNGFPIRAVLATAPTSAQGTVTLNSDGSFTFTPAAEFSGTASFTYTVTDGLATSAPVTVSINVTSSHVSLYAIGAGAGGGPRVRVFNADGSQRFDFFAYEESFKGGVRVAIGDVNGDGVDDIIVGAGTGGGPRVRVYDGQTGNLTQDFMAYEASFRGGVHVAAGDVNGDGKADIITGAGSTGAPRLRVLDANTLNPILDFYAFDQSQIGGVRVAAGDLLGDGHTEIVAASGPSGDATVSVFSGTGSLMTTFNAFASDYRGGLFVNVIGGASGQPGSIVVAQDTVPDFDGSVLNNLYPDLTQAQLLAPPTVRVFDPVSSASSVSLSFTESSEVTAYDETFQNGVRVAGGPASGRNTPNGFSFITGPGEGANSLVKFYRKQGNTITDVREFNAFENSFQGGVYVAASSS